MPLGAWRGDVQNIEKNPTFLELVCFCWKLQCLTLLKESFENILPFLFASFTDSCCSNNNSSLVLAMEGAE